MCKEQLHFAWCQILMTHSGEWLWWSRGHAAAAARASSVSAIFILALCQTLWVPFANVSGVGHFPMDEVPALIASLLDAFVDECALEDPAAAADSASAGGCRPGAAGRINGFTLKGILAAAELDAKV
jgi:hypothetical protein